MPTSYLKLPYEDNVLQPGALRSHALETGVVGYSLDVGLNYYRGLPLSAVETLELSVDGQRVPEHLLLLELNGKLFTADQLGGAFTENWSVKNRLRIFVFNGGIAAGMHDIDLTLILRCIYMQFAPGVWGRIDSSASRHLELIEESR